MIVKICGIKKFETISCCEKNDVNLFGLIFYEKSPRNVSINLAKKLINFSKNLKIKPVGVFVNKELNILKKIIFDLNLHYVQLHGNEDQKYIYTIKKILMLRL